MTDWYFYKSLGICPVCRRRKPMPVRVRCWECTQKAREQRRRNYDANTDKILDAHRSPEYRAYASAQGKKRYSERKKKGLCVVCGKQKQTVGVFCRDCWQKRRKPPKEGTPNKPDHSIQHNLPVPPVSPGASPKTRRQIGAVIVLYNAGWTSPEITEEVRLSVSTVMRYVNKAKEMQDAGEKSGNVRALEERSV